MLHATSVSQPTSLSGTTPGSTPIAGGDAWVVPFEPGAPAWITVGAPQIRVIDRRAAKRGALAAAGR
ncbi:MAG: hypothetical protein Q7T55_04335 [Solirubrobacteraceae bacterium]|nr:hypothetical protein [Solirubrobacteraceae bacterium]